MGQWVEGHFPNPRGDLTGPDRDLAWFSGV